MKSCLRCGDKLKKSRQWGYWACPSCQIRFYPEQRMKKFLAYVYINKNGNWIWREVPVGILPVFGGEEL